MMFINRRAIFSPLVSRAVKEGFATRISESFYPAFVLFIEIPPDQVDVNVHPQKREVRFQNEAKIFRIVQEAVSRSLLTGPKSSPPASFPSFSFPSFSLQESPSALPWESSFSPEIRPAAIPDALHFDLVFQEKALAVCGSYLFMQKEKLFLVDLKALHARLLYESIAVEKQPPQALMWPIEIEVHSDCEDALHELGIECRRIGEKTLAVDALPPFLAASDFPDFFKQWEERRGVADLAARFCRGLKKQYSLEEAQMMWSRLQTCKDRFYDPAGNPISKEIDPEELEKWMAKKR